jgi:hypothetical protein
MKKLPLLLTLTCFTIADSAQQKDFFDVQKYLQKKTKESKSAPKPFVFSKPSFQNFQSLQQQGMISESKLSHALANGDKVYTLLQDNMPCVTTEINRFDISNAYKEHKISSPFTAYDNLPFSMPNGSVVPYKIFLPK